MDLLVVRETAPPAIEAKSQVTHPGNNFNN
jgi:hypothetical protein